MLPQTFPPALASEKWKGQGRCPWTPQRAERPFDPIHLGSRGLFGSSREGARRTWWVPGEARAEREAAPRYLLAEGGEAGKSHSHPPPSAL
jgi:hypothetical protein